METSQWLTIIGAIVTGLVTVGTTLGTLIHKSLMEKRRQEFEQRLKQQEQLFDQLLVGLKEAQSESARLRNVLHESEQRDHGDTSN